MRVTIVGRNPRAGGCECVVFGSVGRATHAFSPFDPASRGGQGSGGELSFQGGWEVRPMRPGPGLATTPAIVGAEPHVDYCRSTGRLVLVCHNWSGVLQINDVGRKYVVDLYSESTRLALLDVVHELMVDVTRLAAVVDGELRLPRMTPQTLATHMTQEGAWFRFLDPDADFEPGALRRAVESLRGRPGEPVRRRVLSALLPRLANSPAEAGRGVAAAPDERTRDEFRQLVAAVEGLALRAAARP